MWVIWIITFAPCRCTASDRFRKCGMISSVVRLTDFHQPWGLSIDTGLEPPHMVMASPPLAFSSW